MLDLAALLGIAMTLSVGTMSPGPSFVLVARAAVSASRADGVAAALGMGVGGVLFAIAALLGLNVLLQAVPSLYVYRAQRSPVPARVRLVYDTLLEAMAAL